MAVTSVAVLVLLCFNAAYGYPSFFDNIPNGQRVPNPCKPGGSWYGVGHLNPSGGGPRNSFGLDFNQAGNRWTTELCQKDSDGDGKTNGQELGDPNCNWQPGQNPSSTQVSHPGVCEPSPNAQCLSSVYACAPLPDPSSPVGPYPDQTPTTTPSSSTKRNRRKHGGWGRHW